MLFRIDPTPYQSEVRALEAQLVVGRGEGRRRAGPAQRDAGAPARRGVGRAPVERATQPGDEPGRRRCRRRSNWRRKRVAQNTELAAAGAGNRFDLEQAQTNVNELTAQIAAARAAEQQVREKLSGRVKGDLAAVAGVKAQIATAQAQVRVAQAQVDTTRAQLENARWNLDQTTVRRAGQRHDGERDAAAGLLRGRHAVQRGDDLRRQRVPDLRAVQPERAAPGRAGQRSGDHARHLPGPHHQGARGLGDLGAGAGAAGCVRRSAADDRSPRLPAGSR